MNEFRELRADEIDVRVQQIKQQANNKVYVNLLLYKDARCDMNILDETVGINNWMNTHQIVGNNLFCTISIYDDEKQQWISKQDVGVESNMQAEKGQASDSFKRAAFRWGIGRELYTAPSLYVPLNDGEWYDNKGKLACKITFKVTRIEYENRRIKHIEIADNRGTVRWNNYNK